MRGHVCLKTEIYHAVTLNDLVLADHLLRQTMMMVVGTVAIGNVVAALVHPGGGDSMEPKVSELVRICRDALYIAPQASAPGR